MIALHGFPMSPNTRRVLFMLAECGAPHELVPVDLMTQAHKSEAYLALNPTGRVPTLVDGEVVLWESNAILTYLAERFPEGGLAGRDPAERASVMRWMFMNAAHLSPSLARIFAHTIRLPEDQRIPKLVEDARADLERSLRALDARLGEHPYLASAFSLAEVSIAPSLALAPMLGVDLSSRPAVGAWLTRIAERPAWKTVYG